MTLARLWSKGWRIPQPQADRLKAIADQRKLSYTRILEEAVDQYLIHAQVIHESEKPTRV